MKYPVITIDGPAASGKGTVARLVAKQLNFHYLDSGAIYRVLAFSINNAGIDLKDVDSIVETAFSLPLRFEQERVFINDLEVSEIIRNDEIGYIASKIASHPQVRRALLDRQRRFLCEPGLVADGRDMGTVVFPDADFKVFLTATSEVRALRRFKQLIKNDTRVTLESIKVELDERDTRDRNRAVAPLIPAADAWSLDSSQLDIDQVVNAILSKWHSLIDGQV